MKSSKATLEIVIPSNVKSISKNKKKNYAFVLADDMF